MKCRGNENRLKQGCKNSKQDDKGRISKRRRRVALDETSAAENTLLVDARDFDFGASHVRYSL